MLWTILVIVLILWLLGFIGGIGGNLIHILIVGGCDHLDLQPGLWPAFGLKRVSWQERHAEDEEWFLARSRPFFERLRGVCKSQTALNAGYQLAHLRKPW